MIEAHSIVSADVKARFRRVRLLSLDVDGVQTDGGLYYDESGRELRRFNVRDGMGIVRLLASGVAVVFITQSATPCIAARARKLGITRCVDGCDDKVAALARVCEDLGIAVTDVAHMGDDINDLGIMRQVGCPVTVADAVSEVARIAVWQSDRPGGHGAVRDLCERLVAAQQ